MTKDSPRCGATLADGRLCNAFASRLSGRCSRHDDARSEEPVAAATARKAFRRDDPRGVKRMVAEATMDVLEGRLSPRAAQAVASLGRTWLQAHDRHELEREIERLSLLAEQAVGAGAGRPRDTVEPGDVELG
jgi:hypothetical protein